MSEDWLMLVGAPAMLLFSIYALGRLHPAALQQRGVRLLARGRPREAEAHLRRNLEAAERHFGTKDRRVALALSALASCLLTQGRADDAQPFVERSLRIVDLFDPLPTPLLALVWMTAARLRCKQGARQEARALVTRARPYLERSGFRFAMYQIEDLLDLADVQRALDAVRGDRRQWKTDAGTLGRLGSAALTKGDASAALVCFQQALEIARRRKPASHEATFYRLRRAEALAHLGRHAEALRDLEHVVGHYAANPSAQIACVAPLLLLAETAATLRDTETARSSCTRLLAILSTGASGQSPYRAVETSPLQEAASRAKQLLAALPATSGDERAGEALQNPHLRHHDVAAGEASR